MRKTKSLAIITELSKLKNNQMLLVCKSTGNPDHGQYAPLSEPEYFIIDCFEQASAASRAYIEMWDLGGGNWTGGNIYNINAEGIANVSYNGRVWKTTYSTEIPIELDAKTVESFHYHYTSIYQEMMELLK